MSVIYDVEDRACWVTDANGVTVATTYDLLGRVCTNSYPDAGRERFGYNARGLVAYTNQIGATNFYAYDATGRKTVDSDANGNVIHYYYDSSVNLTNLVDANTQSTKWNYDEYSRVTNKLDQAGVRNLWYTYDANGQLSSRSSSAKGTTYYTNDAVGNLTFIKYPSSTAIAMQYDSLNRLETMVDAAGNTAYTYTKGGQLLSEDGPFASDTVTNGYLNRLRTSMGLLQPTGMWTNGFAYDPAERLTNVTSSAGTFGYLYSPAGSSRLVARLVLPNSAFITNTYDSVARLLSTTLKNSGLSVLNSNQYIYNPASQRTQQVFSTGNYINYQFDPVGQLKSAAGMEPGGAKLRAQEQLGYAYDPAGNLNYRTNYALLQAFSVNSSNQLKTITRSGTLTVAGATTTRATSVTVSGTGLSSGAASLYSDNTWARTNASPADGNNSYTATAVDAAGHQDSSTATLNLPATVSFTYDSNGNLTGDGTRTFDYDDENQLIRVSTSSWKSEFVYDGKRRRRKTLEYTGSPGAWTLISEVRYIYDGNLVIQERDGNNVRSSVIRGVTT